MSWKKYRKKGKQAAKGATKIIKNIYKPITDGLHSAADKMFSEDVQTKTNQALDPIYQNVIRPQTAYSMSDMADDFERTFVPERGFTPDPRILPRSGPAPAHEAAPRIPKETPLPEKPEIVKEVKSKLLPKRRAINRSRTVFGSTTGANRASTISKILTGQ